MKLLWLCGFLFPYTVMRSCRVFMQGKPRLSVSLAAVSVTVVVIICNCCCWLCVFWKEKIVPTLSFNQMWNTTVNCLKHTKKMVKEKKGIHLIAKQMHWNLLMKLTRLRLMYDLFSSMFIVRRIAPNGTQFERLSPLYESFESKANQLWCMGN